MKHFAVYSNNKGAREGNARTDPQIAPREMEMLHLWPYERVISAAHPLGVMSSYNDYDGIPVTGSSYFLIDVLRKRMGFQGYVVSDSDAVEYLYRKHHVAADRKDAVRQVVLAGLNVRQLRAAQHVCASAARIGPRGRRADGRAGRPRARRVAREDARGTVRPSVPRPGQAGFGGAECRPSGRSEAGLPRGHGAAEERQ
jgi:hypothetical protein